MYYHILIYTTEISKIYEYDYEDLELLKNQVITPYLRNEGFQLNGYFIDPAKVTRLVVTQTAIDSKACLDLAYSKLSANIIMFIGREDCVFDDEYSKNVTREVMLDVQTRLAADSSHQPNTVNTAIENSFPTRSKTLFLAYSYSQADDEFVSGFKALLEDKGFKVFDGKADGLTSISEAIIDKINLSDIVVIIMTKRDKKENGQYTTSAWLLEEKGAALALKKQVGIFIEDEIDKSDHGGLQGDRQQFFFNRNNFLMVVMNFLKILEDQKS